MPGLTIPLATKQQIQAPLKCNVSLVGKTVIPPLCETHVHGRLASTQVDIIPTDYDGIFEPEPQQHLHVASARCLSRAQDGLILIRLINPSQEPIDIPASTNLGQFYAITGDSQAEYEVVDSTIASAQTSSSSFKVSSLLPPSGMTKSEQEKAEKLLSTYCDVFSSSSDDIGKTNSAYHHIETTDKPIRKRAYRTSPAMRLEIQSQVDDLLQRGIIEESYSPWASPIVMVKKKDKTFRFCVDYRALNAVTVRDSHPIPRQDDSIDALSSSTYFSVMDLSSGYWQVPLNPEDKEKTAFTTGTGLYNFNVMPFGLVNAPMTFQRLMEAVLHGLHWSTCLIYLDDCIVLGKNFDDHLHNLQDVLQRFREAGLKLKPSKCQFFHKEVTYLGYVINANGVLPDPNNINKVASWPRPRNPTNVRSFLGLASFYRRFIQNFSKIASPMTSLTHKGMKFNWTEECEVAFETLKRALVNPPLLAYPDFSVEFTLSTDASLTAIGAVLSQAQEGKERVVAYFSQMLTTTQQKWSTYDRELWAIIASVRHFRHYLRGQEFTIFTDHQPLLGYNKVPIQDDVSGRRARWIIEIDAYTFHIRHRKGRQNGHADALSRLPPSREQASDPTAVTNREECSMVKTRSKSSQAMKESQAIDKSKPELPPAQPQVQDQPEIFSLSGQDGDLRQHQQQDEDIRRVISYLTEQYQPTAREIRRESPHMRRYLWDYHSLTVSNGILYRKIRNKLGNVTFQAVVPKSMVPTVLNQLHGESAAGHFGTHRTLQRAKSTCFWPFMHRDVLNYCQTCAACESIRLPNPKYQAPLHNITTDHPLQMVFADIAELPTSRKGFHYILVVVDHFSKYTNIYPMKDQTAQTVAKHLFEDYIKEHGVPETLHTDQGRQFESRLVQDLCRKLGIRKTRSSPYHPQGAGLVERANRVIKEQLAKYLADKGGDWDSHISQVQLAYNSSVHSSTGLTPYYILHGREARVPLNVTCPVPPPSYSSPQEYVTNLQSRLRKAFTHTRQQVTQAQRHQKDDYDRKLRLTKYSVGDLVWLHDPVNLRNKLEPNWRGPYEVISSSHDGLNYKISDIHDTKTTKVVHHNRLKIFRSRSPRQRRQSSSQPTPTKQSNETQSPPSPVKKPQESFSIEWLLPEPEPTTPHLAPDQSFLRQRPEQPHPDQSPRLNQPTDQQPRPGQPSSRPRPQQPLLHHRQGEFDPPSRSNQPSQLQSPNQVTLHQQPDQFIPHHGEDEFDQPSWSNQSDPLSRPGPSTSGDFDHSPRSDPSNPVQRRTQTTQHQRSDQSLPLQRPDNFEQPSSSNQDDRQRGLDHQAESQTIPDLSRRIPLPPFRAPSETRAKQPKTADAPQQTTDYQTRKGRAIRKPPRFDGFQM